MDSGDGECDDQIWGRENINRDGIIKSKDREMIISNEVMIDDIRLQRIIQIDNSEVRNITSIDNLANSNRSSWRNEYK